MSCLDLFPQLGHPVIHERRIHLPQMQVRVVPIAPADEVPQLSAVAVLGLFRARAGALLQESLQKELVPPEHGTGLSGIEEAADVRQGLRLIHARQNRREAGITFGITTIFGKWRNAVFPCGGMV